MDIDELLKLDHLSDDKHSENFQQGNLEPQEDWVKISKNEDLASIGKSAQEINTQFRTDFTRREAIYTPHHSQCNMKQFFGLLTRKGNFIWYKNIKRANLNNQQELNDEECQKFCWPFVDVTSHFPPVYHISGKYKGKLCWPGKLFAMDVAKTLRPEEFRRWYNVQMDKQQVRLAKSKPGGIMIPQEELDAMKEHRANSQGKNAGLKQIQNMEWNIDRKKNLKDKIKKEVIQENIKTFQNPKDLEDNLYNQKLQQGDIIQAEAAYHLFNEKQTLQNTLNRDSERILLLPSQQVSHINDQNKRKQEQARVVNSQEQLFSGLKGKFPEYESIFN